MDQDKAPTLKDIAELCQVSIMTVSRAFRQDSIIHPETRRKILHTAEALNYHGSGRRGRPQISRAGQLRQVQLIFGTGSGNTGYFHMRLLTALEQQLAASGFECIIRTATGDYDIFLRLLENARNHRCVATLVMGDFPESQLAALISTLPGSILLDHSGDRRLDGVYSSFSFDNSQAALLGVNHLIRECGRKRILLVNGSRNHFFSNELLMGYRHALEENQLPFDANLVLYTDFSAGSAARIVQEFIDAGGAFDAVFTNDEMATGVYRVLYENRIRIPEDAAVCGCDELPVGKQLYPELTSISLDYTDLARKAIALLNDSGRKLNRSVHTKLAPVLKRGKSTACSSNC